MQKLTTERKRELRYVSHQKKVQIVLRVLNGESRAAVRQSTGVPESTLRGWLSREEIVDDARDLLKGTQIGEGRDLLKGTQSGSQMTMPTISQFWYPGFPTPMPHWDLMCLMGKRSFNSDYIINSEDVSSDLSSDASSGGKIIDETLSKKPFHWTSDEDDYHDDEATHSKIVISSNNNDDSSGSSWKRKRIEVDCIDDDLPTKRRVKEHHDTSSEVSYRENQQEAIELESRDCKELLHELVEKDTLSRDLFVYLLETLK